MVTVHEASNLAIADSNGFSDPYCQVRVGTEHKRTKFISKTLNPKWHQTITVDVYEGAVEVVLLVYDHDRFSKDEFLGEVVIPLSRLMEEPVAGTEPLQSNQNFSNGISVKGTLTFNAKFEQEGSYKEDTLGSKSRSSLVSVTFCRFPNSLPSSSP